MSMSIVHVVDPCTESPAGVFLKDSRFARLV